MKTGRIRMIIKWFLAFILALILGLLLFVWFIRPQLSLNERIVTAARLGDLQQITSLVKNRVEARAVK